MPGWSTARRAAAAERIRTHKPWQHATGPRTTAGKTATRMNALKHGNRSAAVIAEHRAVTRYLRQQKEFLKQLRLLLRLQRAGASKNIKSTNGLIQLYPSLIILDQAQAVRHTETMNFSL